MMKADEDHSGWPDLFCSHSKFGIRLVEIKLPGMIGSKFTAAQKEWFPKMSAHGAGIWIITSDSPEELNKLLKPANFIFYYAEHF